MSLHTALVFRPSRLRRLIPSLALLCLCALGHAAGANALTVPGQYPTIQAGIDAAANGDTVLISDGTYTGPGNVDLDFGGKNIAVTSVNGATKTVIDCGGSVNDNHRGFYLHSGETNAVISGLTIKNGYESGSSGSDGQGGGIEDVNVGLTVLNCVLTANTARYGGGMENDSKNGSAVLVTGCTLEGNTAVDNFGGHLYGSGSGMENVSYNGGSMVTVTNCTLTGNTAQSFDGGLYNDSEDGGTISVTNCTLTRNTARYGGGMENDCYVGSTVSVTGCTLEGNSAGGNIGGIHSDIGGIYNDSGDGSTVSVTNCTIVGNTAGHGGGGGLYNDTYNGGAVSVTNCTLTANSAPNGGGLYNYNYGGGTTGTISLTNDILYGDVGGEIATDPKSVSPPTATNCDIQGGVPAGTTDGGGNINADPLFVNPPADPQFAPPAVGDVHLRPGSPCLGAGTPSGAPPTDKDGTVRPDPPSIGAYELGSTLTVASDGSGEYATIQAAINAANNGNTVLIADGTYTGPGNVDLDFLGKNIAVTSVNGAAKTVIDCGGSSADHRGFYLHSGETSAVISGLTIKNGYESGNSGSDGKGGGIEDYNVGLTIQNCVFTANTAGHYGGGLYNDSENGSTVTVTGCTLSANTATGSGGGIENDSEGGSTVTVTGCTLSGNTAGYAGGMDSYSSGSTISVTDCTVEGNTAGSDAGGLYNDSEEGGSTISVTNCVVTGNTASRDGGGLYNLTYQGGAVAVTNCTLTANSAPANQGGGLENYNYGSGGSIGLTNDIVYGDVGGEIANDPDSVSPPTATHCDVQGGVPAGTTDGGGNINADPLFVTPPRRPTPAGWLPLLGSGNAYRRPGYGQGRNGPARPPQHRRV